MGKGREQGQVGGTAADGVVAVAVAVAAHAVARPQTHTLHPSTATPYDIYTRHHPRTLAFIILVWS